MTPKPTELAVTLAAIPGRYGDRDGWVYADEVRARLARLGFDASSQQVAAWLRKMARTECPWVEARESPHAGQIIRQYRVTRFGKTDIDNRLRGVRLETPWLPTYRFPQTASTRGTT